MLEPQESPTSDEGILDGSAVSLATEPVRCISTSQSANVGWELLLLSCVQYAPLANTGSNIGIKGIVGVCLISLFLGGHTHFAALLHRVFLPTSYMYMALVIGSESGFEESQGQ